VKDESNIHVAFGSEESVFQTFAQTIAIPTKTDYLEVGIGQFDALGSCQSSAMKAIHTAQIEIIEDLAMAADTAGDYYVI